MAITTILSDLGNVVVDYDNQKMYESFAALSGRKPEDVERILFGCEADESYLIARYSLGQINSRQFHCAFMHALGLCGSQRAHQVFMTAFCDVFTPNRQVIGLWRHLRRQGITLTAVSNIEQLRHIWLKHLDIMKLFDHEVVSYVEGLLKPSEEFMVRALDLSGAMAEETVFIDDIAANLVPAAKLGIHTHCYRDFDKLVEFLQGLGLPVG